MQDTEQKKLSGPIAREKDAVALPADPDVRSAYEMQELFIPVHGFVHLYPEEIAVISHPAFQRLRRVRQLGFAHMVFPGAMHTRFEHSIGAVHVAQRIVDNVRRNYRSPDDASVNGDQFVPATLPAPAIKFVRLAALLHDIGHVPLGHTLEDELEHLNKHDGEERIRLVADKKFDDYDLDIGLGLDVQKPPGGWSLRNLVDALYSKYWDALGGPRSAERYQPFDVVEQIVSKPPLANSDGFPDWDKRRREIERYIPLVACRDMIGNTVCADFLDYLFRDLYHVGKQHFEEKRIYQYMELRTPRGQRTNLAAQRFVINVGYAHKRRHDALTNILQLLDLRYQLAETVLFHRTKLSITGLLDRCLLEVRKLYETCGLTAGEMAWDQYLQKETLELFLDGSDDGIHEILTVLVSGGRDRGVQRLLESLRTNQQRAATARKGRRRVVDTGSESDLLKAVVPTEDAPGQQELVPLDVDIENQVAVIRRLIERLRNRTIYTLAEKWRIDELGPVPATLDHEAHDVYQVIDWYSKPDNRALFLSAVEATCELPAGTVVMYCPPDVKMNAKVADVNLLIDGRIQSFWEYEYRYGHASLTSGALRAQVGRFFHLWSAQFYVDRTLWQGLSHGTRSALRSVLQGLRLA